MTYTLKTANRHLTKFHRTPGAVSHCPETTGVFPDSIHRIVGPTSNRCLSGWARVEKMVSTKEEKLPARIDTQDFAINAKEWQLKTQQINRMLVLVDAAG